MSIVGVDACSEGWIAVILRPTAVQALFLKTIGELNLTIPDAQVVAIDIPIGLLANGRRLADVEGRVELGRRSSTLFVVPPRSALEASTHEEATRRAATLSGSGISRQSYGLRAKIFEVDEWLERAPCPVYEVHPELSFKQMTGAIVGTSKKKWAGMSARRRALLDEGISLDDVGDEVGNHAGIDDMLDAGAAAWSAKRIFDGRARSIPAPPEVSPSGRRIAIWV